MNERFHFQCEDNGGWTAGDRMIPGESGPVAAFATRRHEPDRPNLGELGSVAARGYHRPYSCQCAEWPLPRWQLVLFDRQPCPRLEALCGSSGPGVVVSR
jgi:hypothetical protein